MKKLSIRYNRKRVELHQASFLCRSALFITVMSVLVLSSCSESPQENNSQENESKNEVIVSLTKAQYNLSGIHLGKIEQKQLSNILKVNGVLDAPPQSLVSISAPLGGFVSETVVLQGMKVKKGQSIVVMEHPDYVQLQQDYLDQKSKLEFIEQEYTRQEKLHNEKVSSSKVYEQAKAEYKSAKVQLKGLKEKLAIIGLDANQLNEDNLSRRISINSPINGYVSAVYINIGKYVNPTDVMLEIVNTEHLHVELTVYEKDVVKLKEGQKVIFTLPNESEISRQASIYLIGRKIDNDRAVRVHAHLKEKKEDMLPGMYISAEIELDAHLVNVVPQEAVVLTDGKHYIFINNGVRSDSIHSFKMVEIEKGVSENEYSEIKFLNNENPNNISLVTKGAYSLLATVKNKEEEE